MKRNPRTISKVSPRHDEVLNQLRSLGMEYWSVRLVGEFLKHEHLDDFAPAFFSAQIDGASLKRLGLADEVLRKLGLVATSQRMEFRKRVVRWTAKNERNRVNSEEQQFMGVIDMNDEDDDFSDAYSSGFDGTSFRHDSNRTRLKQQLMELQSKYEELEMERDFLKEQNMKLKRQQLQFQTSAEEAKHELETKQTKLRKLHRSQSKIFDSNTELSMRVAGLEAQLQTYMSAKEEAEAAVQELTVRLNGLEKRHKVVVAQNEHLTLQATVASGLKTQLSDALSEIERLRKEWDVAPNTIVTDSDLFQDLKKKNELMEAELKGFRVLKEKFQQTDFHTLYKENNDLKTENEELSQSNRVLHREISKLHMENEQLREDRDDMEDTIADMKEKYMDAIKIAMKQEDTIKIERRRSKMNLLAGLGGKQLKGMSEDPDEDPDIDGGGLPLGGGPIPLENQRSLTYGDEEHSETPSSIHSDDELSDEEQNVLEKKHLHIKERGSLEFGMQRESLEITQAEEDEFAAMQAQMAAMAAARAEITKT